MSIWKKWAQIERQRWLWKSYPYAAPQVPENREAPGNPIVSSPAAAAPRK